MAEHRSLLERHTKGLASVLAEGTAKLIRDFTQRAERTLKNPSAYSIAELRLDDGLLRSLTNAVDQQLRAGYAEGAQRARREVGAMPARYGERAVHNIGPDDPGSLLFALSDSDAVDFQERGGLVGTRAIDYFRAKAFEVTGLLSQEILRRGKHVLMQSLRQDKTQGQVLFELSDALSDFIPETDAAGRIVNVPARIENIARTNTAEAVGEGRWATFVDPDLEGFVQGVQYSAILDDRTRATHAAWDGVTRAIDDGVWFQPDRRPPNGFQCRCMLVPITVADGTEFTPDDELPMGEAGPSVFPDVGFK